MIDNEVVSRIAQKIRSIRLEKNLTIQQLATRTHVSKGLLSKIENSRTIPSLPVFVMLIQSLEISLKDFFKDMTLINGKKYLHIKKGQVPTLEREGRNGFNYHYILSQNVPNCTLETVLVTIEPGTRGRPTTADGYEFMYVLSGTCEYHIDGEILELEEGDAVYFNASVPHLQVNRSGKLVSILVMYFIVPK